MTREELINFGEMFLEMNEDSKNSSTYKFIDAAVNLFKQESALDKIRAEIEETYINLTYEENHKVGGSWGLRKALKIIDKYKAKSEDKEWK